MSINLKMERLFFSCEVAIKAKDLSFGEQIKTALRIKMPYHIIARVFSENEKEGQPPHIHYHDAAKFLKFLKTRSGKNAKYIDPISQKEILKIHVFAMELFPEDKGERLEVYKSFFKNHSAEEIVNAVEALDYGWVAEERERKEEKSVRDESERKVSDESEKKVLASITEKRVDFILKSLSRDFPESVKWIKSVAEQGHELAQEVLAGLVDKTAENFKKAVFLFTLRLAEQGHVVAQYNLASGYFEGRWDKKDVIEGMKWLKKSAEGGNPVAQHHLGHEYIEGDELLQREGVRYLTASVAQGYAPAQVDLAKCYGESRGVKADVTMEINLLEKAMAQGSVITQVIAQVNLSKCLIKTGKVKEGLRLLKNAAAQNYRVAFEHLGLYYLRGEIVTRDVQKALNLLQKASMLNDINLQYELGLHYLKGRKEGAVKDVKEGVKWLEKAGHGGDSYAQYELGMYYLENGKEGAVKDLSVVIMWLEKSGQGGHTGAQYELGMLYLENGKKGDAKDLRVAIMWLEKAGHGGHIDAQYELGMHYLENGEEVVATMWFKKGAAQEDPLAQEQLRKLNSKFKKTSEEFKVKSS